MNLFENHPSVMQELMYIKSQGGSGVIVGTPEKVLSNARIPVLKETKQKKEERYGVVWYIWEKISLLITKKLN